MNVFIFKADVGSDEDSFGYDNIFQLLIKVKTPVNKMLLTWTVWRFAGTNHIFIDWMCLMLPAHYPAVFLNKPCPGPRSWS